MQFSHSEYLYLLALLPVFAGLFAWMTVLQRRNARRFGDEELVSRLMPDVSRRKPVWKFILLMLAFAFAVIMMAGPRFGTQLEEQKKKGSEIIVALDVSNSMLAQDIKPDRLERAKQALSRLIDRLGDNQIGLIVFAGEAYTQLPITSDYVSAKMFLNTISTESVPVQGTAIGAAIRLAAGSFAPNSEAGKAIIVITDGENHEDNPVDEARKAAQAGINVFTIGIGSVQGTPIPTGAGQSNFIKDKQGNVVMSKLDEKTLAEIAAAGNGAYVHASPSNMGLDDVLGEIGKLNQSEYESKVYSDFAEMFQYPAAIALLLLLLEMLVSRKRNKFRLFEEAGEGA
jgi:Ca-activated chloride channel family protein